MTICSDRFKFLAQIEADSLGMPELPLVLVPHPIGGINANEVIQKADGIVEHVIACLVQ